MARVELSSSDILQALHKDIKNKYPARLNVSEFSTPSGRRIDMLSLDYMAREVKGYEIKVSRGDFKSDKKWTEYLAFCNQFYFVCPKGMIKLDELPPEIGLIYADIGQLYEHYDNEQIATTQKCVRLNIVRGAKASQILNDAKHEYILRRLIFRALDLHSLVEPASFWQNGLEIQHQRGLLDIHGNRT